MKVTNKNYAKMFASGGQNCMRVSVLKEIRRILQKMNDEKGNKQPDISWNNAAKAEESMKKRG